MAFLQMNCFSKSLKREVQFNVILPEHHKNDLHSGGPEGEYKTLYLLHGLTDDHTMWMRRSSIERYATHHSIAVVMPNVDRSWYSDTVYGAKYFTFVTKELPAICRTYFKGMSQKREDTLVAGLSMGGYGALKAALRCPETFGACASLSGALVVTKRTKTAEIAEWKSYFGYELESYEQLAGTEADLLFLAEQNVREGKPFPKLFLWCGTEDHLIEQNRIFHARLEHLGVVHEYRESEGDHSWSWWDKHIQDALEYLLNGE